MISKTLLFLFGYSVTLLGQTAAQDSSEIAAEGSMSIGSFWEISQMAGVIGYFIYAVLAAGLFLIFLQMVSLLFDYRGMRHLRKINFRLNTTEDIEELVKENANSYLGELSLRLLIFYRTATSTIDMHQEIIAFVDQKTEKFESFRGRILFLSDSAGALGLMGTVWGVFMTFFGGSLDSEKILNGMGVALITTLLGLIVSLIINFFGTEINSAFQRRMEIVLNRGDELRLYLLGRKKTETAAPNESTVRV